MTPARWGVVVPVKGGLHAKSRLRGGARLADAIAADTVAAVARCDVVAQVVIVGGGAQRWDERRPTRDGRPELPDRPGSARIDRLADPGQGLNPALRLAAASLRAVAPSLPSAVLLGDLPALRPETLAVALEAAERLLDDDPDLPAVYVPDAAGSGTVLLAARRPAMLDPRFGPASAEAHARVGAARLELDLPDLRRDVDTAEDLRAAAQLGLGPRTTLALRRSTDLTDGAGAPSATGIDLTAPDLTAPDLTAPDLTGVDRYGEARTASTRTA